MVRESVRQRTQLFLAEGVLPSSFYIADSRGGAGLYEAIHRIQERVAPIYKKNTIQDVFLSLGGGAHSSSSNEEEEGLPGSSCSSSSSSTAKQQRQRQELQQCYSDLGQALSLLQFSLVTLVLQMEHVAVCHSDNLRPILQGAKSITKLELRHGNNNNNNDHHNHILTEQNVQHLALALEYHPSLQEFTLHAAVESYNPLLSALATVPQLTTLTLQVPRDDPSLLLPPPHTATLSLPHPPPPRLDGISLSHLLLVPSLRDLILRGPGIYLSHEALERMAEALHHRRRRRRPPSKLTSSVLHFILRHVSIIPPPPTTPTQPQPPTAPSTATIMMERSSMVEDGQGENKEDKENDKEDDTTDTAVGSMVQEDQAYGSENDYQSSMTKTIEMFGTALLDNPSVQSLSIYNPINVVGPSTSTTSTIPTNNINTALFQVIFAQAIGRPLRDNTTTVLRNLTIDFAPALLGLELNTGGSDQQDCYSYGTIIMSSLASNTTVERLVLSHFFWTHSFSLAMQKALGGGGNQRGRDGNGNHAGCVSQLRHLCLTPFDLANAEWKIALPCFQTNTTLKYVKIACPDAELESPLSIALASSSSSSSLSLSGSVATIETARVLNENTSIEYFELQFHYQSAMEYIQAISCLTKNTTLKQLQFSSTSLPPHRIETEQAYQQLISAARGNYGLTGHPSISIATKKMRRRHEQEQEQLQLAADSPTILMEEDSVITNTSSSLIITTTTMTEDEDEWGDEDLRVIETLNRAGRQYLGQDAASKEDAILVFHNVREDLNAIFFHLMENPGLCHIPIAI